MRKLFALVAVLLFVIALVCLPDAARFARDMSYEVAFSVFVALTGLAIKLSVVKFRAAESSLPTVVLDDFVGRLLIRKSAPQTFLGILLWNLLVSGAVVAAGFMTLGILPLI